MKKVKIAELKDNLSRYLHHVRSGGTVLVLDRDRPIAKIVPLDAAAGELGDDDRLAELGRRGVIRRGTGRLPAWFGRWRAVKVQGSVLKDLLDERRSRW